jgi:hypothetical protein
MSEKATLSAKIEAGATVGVLIFAFFAVYSAVEANDKADSLTTQLLQLQNVTSNFQPKILPYVLLATLNDIGYLPNGSSTSSAYGVGGSLNMSFVVWTPHGLILNFSVPVPFNFTVRNPVGINDVSTPDPDKLNSTIVSFYMGGALNGRITSYPEGFIQAGLAQVNFTIPLTAAFYPNPLWLTMKQGTGTELILGNVGIKLSVYDVQTEQYLPTETFSTPLTGWVYII